MGEIVNIKVLESVRNFKEYDPYTFPFDKIYTGSKVTIVSSYGTDHHQTQTFYYTIKDDNGKEVTIGCGVVKEIKIES